MNLTRRMRVVGYIAVVFVGSLAAFLFAQGEGSVRLWLAVALALVAAAGLVVDSWQKRDGGR